MTSREPIALADVPRNDLDAARAYYAARGRLTRDEWSALWRLQDKPREFERESKRWTVVDG
jgi:hypothetical protein